MPVNGKQGCYHVYGIRNDRRCCESGSDGSEAAAAERKACQMALTLSYDRKWIYDKLQRSAGE